MSASVFITLLTSFATITGVVTEFAKKILDEQEVKYSSNLLASIIGAVVGIGGTAVYYIFGNIEFNTINVTAMILMGVAVAVGSMVGYDKIKQLINQSGK